MTVKQIIDKVGTLRRNNQFSIEDKMEWLNQCEAKIQLNCLLMPCVKLKYDYEKDKDEELIAKSPFDELYVYYVCAKIDESLGETTRYNDTIAQHNDVQRDYQKWLIRTHDPKHNKICVGRDVPVVYRGNETELKLYLPFEVQPESVVNALLTQNEITTEVSEVAYDGNVLTVTLAAQQTYALKEGSLFVGYDVLMGGYRYREEKLKRAYVELPPDLRLIAEGKEPSPVDASLTIAGRAADAAETGRRAKENAERIKEHVDDLDNPHSVTIGQIGAAPSGFGIGALTSYEIYSDAEMDTVIIDTINSMGAHSFKRIVLAFKSTNNFTKAGGSYYADIYKASTNYAIITIKSYIVKGREMQRIWYEGVLNSWEWVNPPMILGVEYQTTERHNGKVVYVTRLTVGELLNKGTTQTSLPSVPAEIVSLTGTAKSDAYTETVTFPVITAAGAIGARMNKAGSKDIVVKTFADYSGYVATATVKYTKE